MKKDSLDNLFDRLQGEFDVEEPQMGHQQRFLDKLNQSQGAIALPNKKRNWWKPLSIAASVAMVALLGYQFLAPQPSIEQQVVEMAPEISESQFYFANLIEQQVKLLQDEKSPETAKLVDDTLAQLHRLENDYKGMEEDLINGGDSKMIMSAMITNFQTRIELLKEVLSQIENIKNLKSQNDESFTI
ncbi:hypothetical protein [Flagellimonas sp. GZD32]|uniref:hypothetical protein n=1 Tax=Flagellimonas cixiensis TaxID=3228750 RepID=UPI0035C91759